MARIDVLMSSTSYPADLFDWRALFIRHLADALARRDDIRLRLWSPPGEVHPRARMDVTSDEQKWLKNLMDAGGIAHLMRSGGLRSLIEPLTLVRHLRRAYKRNQDVALYHLNWLQSVLAMPHNGRPLLITALGTDMQLLRLPLMRSLLRNRLKGHPTAICPNADWMVGPLSEAFGDIAEVSFMPFGIDPSWFRLERQPTHPSNWLVVSRLTEAKLGPLFDWAAPLFTDGTRELHLFGPMQEQIEVPDWVHFHGPTTPAELRSTWFPKATGLLTLSRHAEGRPQVMLEAMAAGLPVLASNITAHANFIDHQATGWLCSSQVELDRAIEALEDSVTNTAIGKAARDWATREVGTWDDCATRYMAVYRRLLERASAS